MSAKLLGDAAAALQRIARAPGRRDLQLRPFGVGEPETVSAAGMVTVVDDLMKRSADADFSDSFEDRLALHKLKRLLAENGDQALAESIRQRQTEVEHNRQRERIARGEE